MDAKTFSVGSALLVICTAVIILSALMPGLARAQAAGPVTDIFLNGTQGNSGWYTSDVQVALNATDTSRLGINRTLYGFNDNQSLWTLYTVPFNVTKEGKTTLYYASVDNASMEGPVTWVVIAIDRTPPTLTYTLTPAPNANGWASQPVQVHFDYSDGVSGILYPPHDLNLTNEGVYTGLKGEATDVAGNTATIAVPTIGIDLTPPALGKLTMQGNAYAGDYVSASASLVEANPDRMVWDWGDGSGSTAIVSQGAVLGSHSFSQPGVYKVVLTVSDKAGQTATSSGSITVYGTAPTTAPVTGGTSTPVITPTPTAVPLPATPTATPSPSAGIMLAVTALFATVYLVARRIAR